MPNRTFKSLIPFNGVSKLNGMPKNNHATFLTLDIKTHCIEFNLKMFMCKQYNEKGPYDVNAIYNRWK
jgi:hypothetical protein